MQTTATPTSQPGRLPRMPYTQIPAWLVVVIIVAVLGLGFTISLLRARRGRRQRPSV